MTVEASNSAGTDTQAFTISVVEAPDCDQDLAHYWMLEEIAGTEPDAGLGNVRYRNLSGGIAALHSAWRI